ncbi:MAG: class I SAM-dependent methyltransferase [Erythrobacter sp.]
MKIRPGTSTDQQFWDRIAPKYARKPIKDEAAYEAMVKQVRRVLRPNDRVLELGCGTGSTALLLAPHVERVIATDISSKMIEIALSKLGSHTPENIEFRQADAADLIGTGSFDAILASSLLHLVRSVPLVLEQAFKQLRPGGLFIAKTVCLKHASAPIRAMVRILSWIGLAPKVAFLSLDDLETEIDRAGFLIEHIEYFGTSQINPFIVARRPL